MNSPDPTAAASASTGFADATRGRQPHALDRELPSVLQDLYAVAEHRRQGTAAPATELPGHWARMDDAALRQAGIDPGLLHDAKSGFDAGLYRDPQGHVVVALCGTDETKDWKHNIGQGLGFDDAQYGSAIRLAKEARQAFGSEVVLSGHSLGGGLAAAAAMASNTPAITYNAAGVNSRTLEREGLDAAAAKAYAADGLIRGYHVKNELLTHLQEDSLPLKWAMPNAAGHQIELPEPDPLSFGQRLIPGKMLMHRLDLHGIDSVMKAQDLQQLREHDGRGVGVQGTSTPGGRLFNDAVDQLKPQREQLGLGRDADFFNTAAGVAARAGSDGLSRIDHLVASRDGERLVAVQGRLDDPGHLRSQLPAAEAAGTPAPSSVSQLQQQDQGRVPAPAQPEDPQRHRALG